MSTDILYNKKWQKFQKRIWLFRFIPFVDFVLASGSLATGRVNENSDFDVIVGVRQGRIFTARFFCWLIFGALGWRAKHPNNLPPFPLQYYVVLKWGHSFKDKFCFNHFVTPNAYRLSPPYNEYWKNLYQKLIPVYGKSERIQEFFNANSDWAGNNKISSMSSISHISRIGHISPISPIGPIEPISPIGLVRYFEKIFSTRFGDRLEKMLKAIQISKIEKMPKSQNIYKPRIIINDNELEFHPHTKRIEDYIKESKKV